MYCEIKQPPYRGEVLSCLAGFSAVVVTAATSHFSKTLTIAAQQPVGTALSFPPAAARCKEPFQYYDYEHISDKEMFDEYCQGIKNYSLYDTGLTAEYGEELVTLCTCSYSGKDQRLLVVGRRLY
ncbi:hypothetical protein AALA90_18520 [Lachnospiraceae bacterium 38-10]